MTKSPILEAVQRQLGLDFESDPVLSWLIVIAALHAIVVLLVGLDAAMFDRHTFRQTQTAISSYWILQGGPWFAYETPVLGYPWSIPMEFPTYQLLVMGLAKLSGWDVVVAGRWISFVFFVAALPLFWALGRLLDVHSRILRVFALFYLLSPLYLFWGRTVMIESVAFYFSLVWFYGLAVLFRRRFQWSWLFICVFAGCLAALTKITTFFAFAVAGALLVLYDTWQNREVVASRQIGLLFLSVFLAFLPLLVILLWIDFGDSVKQQNLLGRYLLSDALQQWNYGTLQQRLELKNWGELAQRSLKNFIGPGSLVLLLAAFYVRFSRSEKIMIAGLLLCWLAPFLVFFNLHYVHDYYQYANAVFFIAVLALLMFRILEDFKPRKAWTIFGVVCVISVVTFYNSFFVKTFDRPWFLDVTDHVQQNTTPEQAIVAFGFDWSAHVAFYSQRKSITFPSWAANQDMQKILNDPEQYLGGMELGAIVVDNQRLPANQQALLASFLAGQSPTKKIDIREISVFTEFGSTVSAPAR